MINSQQSIVNNQQSIVEDEHWDKIILPQKTLFHIPIKELWEYRDLLFIFVHRNFVAAYKQSILGPFWHLIQPILTTSVYMVVFNRIANISTDGVPPLLFYICGVTLWQFFSSCLMSSSNAFISNAGIFSKVYFPRLIIPLSSIMSAFIELGIKFILLILIYLYLVYQGESVSPNQYILMLPIIIGIMGTLGLGAGIMISSLTTKYRDLSYLVGFGVQLLMYASPVIYPMSAISPEYQKYVMFNPLAPLLESFKYCLTGAGTFDIQGILYSGIVALVLLIISIFMFNRVENKFVDTL